MTDTPESIHTPTLWRDNGWTARVIKNEDDEGWAVAMTRDGEVEPARSASRRPSVTVGARRGPHKGSCGFNGGFNCRP